MWGFMKKIYLLITILTSFFLTEVTAEPSQLKADPKIIVIGAGISGLTTAYRLQQKGFDVHVYEAKNRIGGRIFTVRVHDRVAELGAQNILNGGEAKNVLSLVDEMGLKLVHRKIDFTMYYHQNNELLSVSKLLKTQQFNPDELKYNLQEISKKSKNMNDVLLKLFDPAHPLYKILSVTLAAYEGGSLEHLSPLYYETLYHMLMGGLCAVHPGSEEKRIDLDLLSTEGGMNVLTEKLAEKLKITTNTPLRSVSKNLDGSFDLSFQNGQHETADILILAMPCSVYKDITFEKGVIQESRLSEIMNVQYGSLAKMVVPVDCNPPKRGMFINDQAVTFSATNPQILNLYLLDEASLFSSGSLSEIYQEHISLLETGFGVNNLSSSMPVAAVDQPFACYEGPVGHSWPEDPFAKGSFSCIGAGQEAVLTETSTIDGEIVKTLFSPIDQRLYFVGEHTSIMKEIPGTMEAACESGERIARMIYSTWTK
jgi:monoamine oxidase